jgi:hypothetical protein
LTTNIRSAIGRHLEDESPAELGIAPDTTILSMADQTRFKESPNRATPGQPLRPRKDPLLAAAGACDVPPFSADVDAALCGD